MDRVGVSVMSVACFRLALVGETMFPLRVFFFRDRFRDVGDAIVVTIFEEKEWGNFPVFFYVFFLHRSEIDR